MSGNEPLLSARALSVVFEPEDRPPMRAVEDFALEVRHGEFVGLMGGPGCGKSTAALALMGLVRVPGRITSGEVRFAGRDLLAIPEAERAALRGRDIGLVVQNPRSALHPLLDIGTQISQVVRAHTGVSRKAAASRAIEMLRMVGINDPARRVRAFPHELSTGMAQRVLIAIALSTQPRLLIADEPTSGLDVTIQAQFLDSMYDVTRATGSALILVTQNLGIVANYCDRVAVMHRGTVVEEAPVRTFFSTPQHAYSRRILALQQDASAIEAPASGRATTPVVEVRDMSKNFVVHGGRAVVHAADHVSFTIGAGECLGLVGESGSGKTTTGRCLLRLEAPSAGEILFRGENVATLPDATFRPLRARLQIVFQDPLDSMTPGWTVGAVLDEMLRLHTKLDAPARRRRVGELLTLVGLNPQVATAVPAMLGSGSQQRVAIARAIAPEPAFIVLDEPTSALTPETTAEIIMLLRDLSRRLGLAYLFISHDLTTVKHLCHRVAVMYLGQVVEMGTRDQIFSTPRHPYTRALLAAHLFPDLTNRRVDRASRTGLAGEIPSPIDLPHGCYLSGRCPDERAECSQHRQELRMLRDGRHVRCWLAAEAGQ